jgi:hypothetical protein
MAEQKTDHTGTIVSIIFLLLFLSGIIGLVVWMKKENWGPFETAPGQAAEADDSGDDGSDDGSGGDGSGSDDGTGVSVQPGNTWLTYYNSFGPHGIASIPGGPPALTPVSAAFALNPNSISNNNPTPAPAAVPTPAPQPTHDIRAGGGGPSMRISHFETIESIMRT